MSHDGAQQLPRTARLPAKACWVEVLETDEVRLCSDGQAGVVCTATASGEVLNELRAAGPACVHAPLGQATVARGLAEQLAVPLLLSVSAAVDPSCEQIRDCVVIAANESVAALCIGRGAPPASVVTILPPVDRAVYTPEAREAQGPTGSPALLCIFDDVPGGGVDRLLDACGGLRDVAVVHAGKSSRDWSKYSFARHIEGDLGPEWFRWADALVVPGEDDQAVRSVAQAFACGTPAVVAASTSASQFVIDKWNGLHFDPARPQDLSRALTELSKPGAQARLAAPARTASDVFDSLAVAARFQALVTSLSEFPRVSVVLPTYRRARLIEKAVRNVLAQDYPNFELIVVNDGSPDETEEILSRLQAGLADKRLRVITRENGGLPVALNTGFKAATGEYWTWTSDDNAYKPGALRALVRELQMSPGAGLVFANMEVVSEDGRRSPYTAGPVEALREKCCVGACFMYRKSVAQAVGEYDPNFRLVEDYDYWLRMIRVAEMVHLQRDLYDYHDEPDSLSRQRFLEVMNKHIQLLQREFGKAPGWRDHLYSQLAWFSGWHKNRGAARLSAGIACRMIRLQPMRAAGWWALLRAMTPRAMLNLSRRARGLDAS